MSKANQGNNACTYMSEIRDEGKRGLVIPPKKYKIGVSQSDVENNKIKFSKVDNYEIKAESIDGDILRIGNHKYSPVSKEKKSQYIVKEIDGQIHTLRVGSKSPSISKESKNKNIENFNITKEDNSR